MGGGQVPGPTTIENRQAVDPPGPGVVRTQQAPVGGNQPQSPGPRLVGWPRKIEWREFTPLDERPPGEKEDAAIHSEGRPDTDIRPQKENGRFRISAITIRLVVIREDTWVVKGKQSDTLLVHEQGHFDITGLVGRELGEALLAIRSESVPDLQREVNRIIEHYRDQAEKLTTQYDTETDHGRKPDEQERWNKKLDDCIKNGKRLAPAP